MMGFREAMVGWMLCNDGIYMDVVRRYLGRFVVGNVERRFLDIL